MNKWKEQDAAQRADLRETRRGQLQGLEDRLTSDPENTILGPAAATATGLASDFLLNKEDDAADAFDPTGGMGMVAGTAIR